MSDDHLLNITIEHREPWTVIDLKGDLDVATSPQLEDAYDSNSGSLAVDMSDVRFVDSSGLRALLQARDVVDTMVLIAPSGVVRRLLALTKTTDAFQIVDSFEGLQPTT